MSASKIRVGVIGVGRMGERHCRIYSTLGDAAFVGVSDMSAVRGRDIAARYDVDYFEDYADLLGHVDAVSVVAPTQHHHAIASECLRRGINVLVEKPIASSVVEAADLIRLARRHSAILQVGHIERFNPAFLELQSIACDLEVVAIAARRLSPFDTSNTDIDVVLDLMIHDIDLALALSDRPIDAVTAHGQSRLTPSADYAVANLQFADGPMATLTASRITEQKVRQLELTALGAYVEADLLNKSVSIYRRIVPEYITNHSRPLRYRQESLVERIYIPTAEPLMLELQDFVACVREGKRPKVAGEDGLRALELATQVRERIGSRRAAPELLAS
jgi:predicted dehydrogenase